LRTGRGIARSLMLIVATTSTLLVSAMSAGATTSHAGAISHARATHLPQMNCPQNPPGERNVTATVQNGKFVGDYHWGQTGSPHGATFYWIDVNGTLSSTRGKTTLYLEYKLCRSPHHDNLGSVTGGHHVRISKNPATESEDLGPYTDIRVYVCNNYRGYRCGRAV
jgi:hypothetical protein